ncbi:hypothetical protein DE146DRAFT_661940 [Phaeosphaeria sp. MPI-PUGE-AT-0046c]|nr:hypothetical protein DE146DRAFT_661940 [Phaeosphaeria sp. MPI-PUGE-AT-0046c]
MAPRIVYGKKKNTTHARPNFSNFVSPRKDEAAGQDVIKGGVDTKDNWQTHLENAAAQTTQDDALKVLEEELQSLSLTQPQTEGEVESKKRSRSRKPAEKGDTLDKKKSEDTKAEDDEIEGTQLAEGARIRTTRVQVVIPARKPKRRVALQTCDANENRAVAQNAADICTQDAKIPASTSKQRTKAAQTKPVASRGRSLPTPEATPEPEDIYSTYAAPLLSLSYGRKVVPFERWSSELEPHFDITKIAEASFSEVYRLSSLNSVSAPSQESVLKVVALKTPPEAPFPCQIQARAVRDREGQLAKEMAEREENDVWKSDIADVLSEVKLLQNLNHIPGFTNFRDLTILQGRPSPAFADAWKSWNKSRPRGKKSEFPDPSKKISYEDTQLWAIVEMQDAGTDCEKIMEYGGLSSIWEVWDVFWGVCLSVAKAEEACRFEHRDLHMGNICVRSSRSGGKVTDVTVNDPIRRKFRFTGLETTVIDYTLSRAEMLPSPSRRSSCSTGCTTTPTSTPDSSELDVAWLDLNKDPALFEGDASEEYQYEIYRYMRGAALFKNPMQSVAESEIPEIPRRSPRKNTHIRFDEDESDSAHKTTTSSPARTEENIWKSFHPKTNLVWTHFLLHKLLTHLEACVNVPSSLSTKQIMANVESDEEPAKIKKKAMKLHSVLKKVSERLCPVALGQEESLGSVKELVVLALEERWVRVGDVEG